ncbi:hypothetical protein [Alkalicoccus urumqiensis]|uniref:Fimbrial assembly protein n=1 Tax=Alkalicoccus urumqiensis TaxID=1548213 RepID=A0A2P6MF34_ALKUR|nr:hypothetical protein [Alkalicoccus urumqiensis]PRO64898.1 hypothetical protein C6I21_12185 [Alkalicoccus urumqiensis]
MPVEINLLPKKRKRSGAVPKSVFFILAAGLLGVLLLFFLGQQFGEDREMAEDRLQEKRIEAAELERTIQELQNSDNDELEARIQELDEKVVPASVVLQEAVRMMPPEGTMTLFDYSFPDNVQIEWIATSMPDVALYQNSLESSALIQRAELDTVIGEEILEELEEDIFWYEEYLPQYFTTMNLVLHPDAVRSFEPPEEEVEDLEDEVDLP